MDPNITIDTLDFDLAYSDKDGSVRREISRGVSLPELLTIKHQTYKDTTTKLSGTRSLVRVDRHIALDTEGVIAPVSAYVVVTKPNSASVTDSDILAVVSRLVTLFAAATDSGLELAPEIFVKQLQ